MARPEGLEPPTLCLEGRRSIQLSYGRVVPNFSQLNPLGYDGLVFVRQLGGDYIGGCDLRALHSPGREKTNEANHSEDGGEDSEWFWT